jgi:hypothetical protein
MRLGTRSLFFATAAILATSTLAAHADTFQYQIVMAGDTVVFDESSLLQVDTTIAASNFISSTDAFIVSAEINSDVPTCSVFTSSSRASCVGFQFSDGGLDGDFYNVPLNTPGTFKFGDGSDEIVITDLDPSASPVPEPSTFVFLGTGLLGLAGAARRKFIRQL